MEQQTAYYYKKFGTMEYWTSKNTKTVRGCRDIKQAKSFLTKNNLIQFNQNLIKGN